MSFKLINGWLLLLSCLLIDTWLVNAWPTFVAGSRLDIHGNARQVQLENHDSAKHHLKHHDLDLDDAEVTALDPCVLVPPIGNHECWLLRPATMSDQNQPLIESLLRSCYLLLFT